MLAARVVSLLIGYIFGMFVSGFFLGKFKHVDLREKGSGNVGTTNTARVLGLKYGAITLLCDCLKPVLASLVVWLIFGRAYAGHIRLLILYASFGAVLGHDFPAFMKFKGGKGVATSVGLILLCFPQAFPISAVLFFSAVGITRYVSLGSILAAVGFGAQAIVMGYLGWLSYPAGNVGEAVVIAEIISVLVIILHRSNIARLKNGTENKFSLHKK